MLKNEIGKRRIIKIAHRGASAYEPENTLRAFEEAIRLGADMIELDVRLSKDGELVVIHDDRLERTTDGFGFVGDKTLAELKTLDAGRGEKIPTLREVLDITKGRARLVIELKEEGTEELALNLIRESGSTDEVIVVSFSLAILRKVKELSRDIKTGAIYFMSANPIRRVKESSADAIAPYHYFVTKALVKEAHENNLIVIPWTVDSKSRAQKLIEMGVDGIVSNKPDLI